MAAPRLHMPMPRPERDTQMGHAPTAAAIDVLRVARVFRGGLGWRKKTALADVSLSLPIGRALGLIGANGSGKTTLLRILAGVDRPTSGAVRILGHAPTDRRTRSRLSFLPDGAPFPEELSAPAVLDLIGALGGLDRRTRRMRGAELLERVGLSDTHRAPLRTFSRGMHRRFGLAQAFLTEPDVLLLDEPTAGLDAPGFQVLAELLAQARERGVTVVLASHVASDLIDHCDELVLLSAGRVERQGTPDELLGSSDTLEVKLRGVRLDENDGSTDALTGALTRSLMRDGAEVVDVRPARRSLADLYRESDSSTEDADA